DLVVRVAELKSRSFQAIDGFLKDLREESRRLSESRMLRDPLSAFEALFQHLDELVKNFRMIFQRTIDLKRERAGLLIGKLETLGPLATLKRGFSVSFKMPQMKIVSSVRSIEVGDEVQTKVQDGFFVSRVTEVRDGG